MEFDWLRDGRTIPRAPESTRDSYACRRIVLRGTKAQRRRRTARRSEAAIVRRRADYLARAGSAARSWPVKTRRRTFSAAEVPQNKSDKGPHQHRRALALPQAQLYS